MDPLFIALALVVFFVLFLMATSGSRKHRLEKALQELEKERLRLKKEIEHVKISFYKKQLGENEAQGMIFEHEVKLRDIERKISEIKEKPLMRTLARQEAEKKTDVVAEEKEVKRSEGMLASSLDAKVIVMLFAIVVIVVVIAVAMAGKAPTGTELNRPHLITLPMTAQAVPTEGTYPGSTAGLRVNIENNYIEDLTNVIVSASTPEGSGLRFEDGDIGIVMIPELESGGNRDLFFPISVSANTSEGTYIIKVNASDSEGQVASTTASIAVRLGAGTTS